MKEPYPIKAPSIFNMMSSISKTPVKVRSCNDSINKINLMKILDAIFSIVNFSKIIKVVGILIGYISGRFLMYSIITVCRH